MKRLSVLLVWGLSWGMACPVQANQIYTGWIAWPQPDGTTFMARAFGDEFAMTYEAADGYRFVPDYQSGYSFYTELDESGEFRQSAARVGIDSPERYGIRKGLKRSPERLEAIREAMARRGYLGSAERERILSRAGKTLAGSANTWASPTTLDVVLVTFQDDPNDDYDLPYGTNPGDAFGRYSTEDFRRMLTGGYDGVPSFTGNLTLSNGEPLPTLYGSLRAYFDAVSDERFQLQVNILNPTDANGYPVPVALLHTKAYYASGTYYRAGAIPPHIVNNDDFLEDAQDAAVSASLPVPTSPSVNHKVLYLYSGPTVPNQYALHPQVDVVTDTDGNPMGYRITMGEREGWGNNDHDIDHFAGIGTHAHEFGHLLGLVHPDGQWTGTNPHPNPPQPYTSTRANVLGWGLMQGGGDQGPALVDNNPWPNGFTAPYRSCPNPMSAFYRMDLGWATVHTVTQTTHNLQVQMGPENLYRIDTPNGMTYLLEHRVAQGFGQYVSFYHYSNTPGLLIWRRENPPGQERPILIVADGRRIANAREDDYHNPDIPDYLDLLTDPFPGPDNVQHVFSRNSTDHLRQATFGYAANPDPGDAHLALRNIRNNGYK